MKKEIILAEINGNIKNVENFKKKKVIQTILNNPKWYIDVTLDTFINILFDLGYTKEKSIELYKFLITH